VFGAIRLGPSQEEQAKEIIHWQDCPVALQWGSSSITLR
jgi:hypothetical protein